MAECCKKRKKLREPDEMRALENRLKRIEGQVRGVRTMLEEEAYCVDVLTQVSAISSALDAFTRQLLASHIRSCVVEDIKAGREDAPDELVDLVGRLIR
ncbi:MAG: metal-sensing transcriptional repressor [Clostridia bacterium]|nr:metal-sensing transcriptional repressor [Clostridia bacterium]